MRICDWSSDVCPSDLIGSVMKFAIALFAAAHAPSSRRALLFAQAALAGGHEIVRLFFYQDGVYNVADSLVTPQDEQDLPKQWRAFVSDNQLEIGRAHV